MAKRLSRVAMVKETGDEEAVDKTKLAFSRPRAAWRNQLRQMLAGGPWRLACRKRSLPRRKQNVLTGSRRQPDKI
jgi:hypothetical protein